MTDQDNNLAGCVNLDGFKLCPTPPSINWRFVTANRHGRTAPLGPPWAATRVSTSPMTRCASRERTPDRAVQCPRCGNGHRSDGLTPRQNDFRYRARHTRHPQYPPLRRPRGPARRFWKHRFCLIAVQLVVSSSRIAQDQRPSGSGHQPTAGSLFSPFIIKSVVWRTGETGSV